MEFTDINEVFGAKTKKGRTGRRFLPKNGIMFSKVTEKKDMGERTYLNVAIGGDLLKKVRWIKGDKIAIGVNDKMTELEFSRVPNGSGRACWTLSVRERKRKIDNPD